MKFYAPRYMTPQQVQRSMAVPSGRPLFDNLQDALLWFANHPRSTQLVVTRTPAILVVNIGTTLGAKGAWNNKHKCALKWLNADEKFFPTPEDIQQVVIEKHMLDTMEGKRAISSVDVGDGDGTAFTVRGYYEHVRAFMQSGYVNKGCTATHTKIAINMPVSATGSNIK